MYPRKGKVHLELYFAVDNKIFGGGYDQVGNFTCRGMYICSNFSPSHTTSRAKTVCNRLIYLSSNARVMVYVTLQANSEVAKFLGQSNA